MTSVFITGCNRGLGLSLTKQYLQKGAKVYGSCRNHAGARDLWELESDYEGRLTCFELDVSNESSIRGALKAMPEDWTIDVLINNAAVNLEFGNALSALTEEALLKSYQVNTIGPLFMSKHLMPFLANAQEPKIINISSKLGSIQDNNSGHHYPYRLSKTALNMVTKNLATEFPKILSLSIHPGWVQTDMGGPQAPLTPEESAKSIVDVISQSKLAQSGQFLDYSAEKLAY